MNDGPFTSLFTPTGSVSLTAGPVSTAVGFASIGSDLTAVIRNDGAVRAFLVAGNSTVVATSAGIPIDPGNVVGFAQGFATTIAAITLGGAAALVIESGTGNPEIVFAGLEPGAILTDPIINGGTITGATIIDSTLSGFSFADPIVTGGTFSDPAISGGTIIDAAISGGTIADAHVAGGTIDSAAITGAVISGASIEAGTLDGVSITNSQIASTDISGGTIDSAAVTGLATPVAATDAANKSYVDAVSQGFQPKQTATVATTGALPTNSYANGTAGVGATITVSATGTLTIDGYLTALHDVVLVKDEAAPAHNGLYSVTTAGDTGVQAVLTRTTDMDSAGEFVGALIPVGSAGAVNANSLWLANPSTPVVVGTTAIPFFQLNIGTDWTAGPSITISGNQILVSPITAGLVGSNGTSLTPVTAGAALALVGGVLSNTGVRTIGGLAGAVTLGDNLSAAGSAISVTNLGTATVVASDGPVARTLASRFGEKFNIWDFQTNLISTDFSAAMLAAIAAATSAGGGVIYLPPGTYNMPALTAASGPTLVIPSNVMVEGAGKDQTIITWNDSTCLFSLFSTAVNSSNITFRNFTILGSFPTNGYRPNGTTGGYPIIAGITDHLRFENVGIRFSRIGGIFARGATDITAQACDIRYCPAGAINFSQCTLVTVNLCTIYHCDDDAISVHSSNIDPWTTRRNVVITSNRIFDAQGISVLAPRNLQITGNNIDCVRTQGITVSTTSAAFGGAEGKASGDVVNISGNTITNVFSRTTIDGDTNDNVGIEIGGSSARPGALGTIPGFNIPATGVVVDPVIYFDSNSTSSTVATPLSQGFLISNNTIVRNLPPCDGTATATGGNGKTYNNYADYGFGPDAASLAATGNGYYMFTRHGWVNPSIPEQGIRFVGVRFDNGYVRNALVSTNTFRGLRAAVAIVTTTAEDLIISGNLISDCATGPGSTSPGAILINTPNPCRIYVISNTIDVDPYQRHPNRLPHGKWNVFAAVPYAGAVWVQSGTGVVVRNNTFRNCMTPVGGPVVADVQISGPNFLECNPVAIGSSLNNVGIGVVNANGSQVIQTDGDPTSATYMQILNVPKAQSDSLPTDGFYIIGTFLRKTFPIVNDRGSILTGWARETTGVGNVLGVDWIPIYSTVIPNDLTALAEVGSSNGTITAVVAASGGPGGFQFLNYGGTIWPVPTISAAGTGGTDGALLIDRMATQWPNNNTIDPTTTISFAGTGSPLTLITARGSLYASGQTLTVAGGTFSVRPQATISSVGTAGDVTGLVVLNTGTASAYPPAPASWTGGSGGGFMMHAALWAIVSISVTNGGYYPNGTPTVSLPTGVQNSGLLTVEMGQSFYADTTGAHIAKTTAYPLVEGGTVTLSPSAGPPAAGPGIAIIEITGSITAGTFILPGESLLAPSYLQEFYSTGTCSSPVFISPGTFTIHGAPATLSPAGHATLRFLAPGTITPGWYG